MLEKNCMEEPRNSVVQVTFGERNGTYSYYNDQFDLHRGDFVYVEGEFEGMIGYVLDVHYNFKAKRSVFKRVVSRLNVEQLDRPLLGGERLLFFDRKVLDPEKAALILGVRKDDDDDDYYIGSGDPAFSMDNMEDVTSPASTSCAATASFSWKRSFAIRAAPKAPMIPAISGRMASQFAIFSKLLSTASL